MLDRRSDCSTRWFFVCSRGREHPKNRRRTGAKGDFTRRKAASSATPGRKESGVCVRYGLVFTRLSRTGQTTSSAMTRDSERVRRGARARRDEIGAPRAEESAAGTVPRKEAYSTECKEVLLLRRGPATGDHRNRVVTREDRAEISRERKSARFLCLSRENK